jgi:DeoR family transcriptional regulator, glycerol-3-phosphate regulon repressor
VPIADDAALAPAVDQYDGTDGPATLNSCYPGTVDAPPRQELERFVASGIDPDPPPIGSGAAEGANGEGRGRRRSAEPFTIAEHAGLDPGTRNGRNVEDLVVHDVPDTHDSVAHAEVSLTKKPTTLRRHSPLPAVATTGAPVSQQTPRPATLFCAAGDCQGVQPAVAMVAVMQHLSRRQNQILDRLAQRGYVAIEEMVATFDVSPQTLRRDLQILADRGMLRRHHGGASASISTANVAYGERHIEMAAEKAAIGRTAAELVRPGSSLFLTPGTTVDALAKAIADRAPSGLRVVTNSTVAAAILETCPGIDIQLTGGSWFRHNRAVGGMAALSIVETYRCDLHLTSIGAINAHGDLLEYRDDEVIVGRAMLKNARRRILLADHTKFSRVATSRLGHLRDFDALITDRRPSRAAANVIKEAGCELVVAR